MKIEIKDNIIVLKELYNTILLETESGKQLYVCMRDGKFEISTDGKNWTMTHTAPQYIDAVEEITRILNEELNNAINKEDIPLELTLRIKALGFYDGLIKPTTFYQAFRWFRENHFLSSDIAERMRDGKRITHFFISDLKTNNKFFKTISSKSFTDYEEAELACLTKLIEIVEQK